MLAKQLRLALAATLIWAAAASGQFVISVMAGFIHQSEGEVFLEGEPIAPKPTDFLHAQERQRLRTGRGRAELMLTPGSFVRLGPDSELEMVSAGLLSARVRLHAGSMLVDLVDVFEESSIAVEAGEAEILLVKPGLYRFDASDQADASVQVIRGRARASVGEAEPRGVKGGRELRLVADAKPEKIGDQEPDELRHWSDGRSEVLGRQAKAARKEQLSGMSAAERDLYQLMMRRPMPQSTGGSSAVASTSSGSSGGSQR